MGVLRRYLARAYRVNRRNERHPAGTLPHGCTD
jgi:hypothetical protein